MKVIDILNKIANGEPPKKIKMNNHIMEYKNDGYEDKERKNFFWTCCFEELNDEVEIIEEDKKIERIKIDDELVDEKAVLTDIGLQRNLIKLINKINEIIDVINKGD